MCSPVAAAASRFVVMYESRIEPTLTQQQLGLWEEMQGRKLRALSTSELAFEIEVNVDCSMLDGVVKI